MSIFVCTSNKGKLLEFETHFKEQQIIGISDLERISNTEYQEPSENSDCFLSNGFSKLFSAIEFVVASHDENPKILSNINQIIVDDSGLCVPALQFEPGVHSAIYAGLPRNDEKNNIKLKEQINNSRNVKYFSDEKRLDAFFICFLFSINIDEIRKFNFVKKINATYAKEFENENVIKMENSFLNQVDLSLSSGNYFHKVPMNLFSTAFPEDVFIDISCGFCNGEVSTKVKQLAPFGHGYDPLFYPKIHSNLSFAEIPVEEKNKISHRALALKKLND
jgi:inosine/xanthosine triphosphate pyrophosphatase family protein